MLTLSQLREGVAGGQVGVTVAVEVTVVVVGTVDVTVTVIVGDGVLVGVGVEVGVEEVGYGYPGVHQYTVE